MAQDTPYRFIYITASSREEALKVGRSLVEQRLAACANVLDDMTSIYWWKGQVEEAREAVLIVKTTVDRVDAIIAAVRKEHSYECPCVVALPVVDGLPAYLRWIHDETHG